MIGTSLGPYKIIEQLGAGGMGEVYLGEDTRLGRKVAIKVLPAEFASDPERLARFEQEARAAAALNHPHIAAVFDVGQEPVEVGGGDEGDSDSGDSAPVKSKAMVHYIVQEYLEGQTLGALIDNKGALPTKKALDLGVEIATALSAAHEAGIVHRDLKPANVFVSPDSHAKVLDFGLAKLTELAAINADSDSRSPTMLGTVAGQVMGTAGYMAPEQVEGDEVDHRADLFAFGCVLYEMATGRRAFAGKNVLDTLHRIANSEPQPLVEVSDHLPADLQRILRKCLAKEPAARYQTGGDLAVDLRALAADVDNGTALSLSAVSSAMPQAADHSPAGAARPAAGARRSLLTALGGGIVGLVVGGAALWWLFGPAPAEVSRFEIALPEGWSIGQGLDFSADGRELIFAATDPDGRAGLYRRRLDELEPVFIPGSEEGELPRVSPDGGWIVFGTTTTLRKIPADGGEPLELASYGGSIFSNWAPGDTVVYENGGTIYRISSAGGEEEVLATQGGEPRYDHPFALDNGNVLISIRVDAQWSVGAIEAGTGEVRPLIADAVGPQYLEQGYLTFGRDGAVWAQTFDPDALAVSGTPFPLRAGVWHANNSPQFAVARNGTMAYLPGAGAATTEAVVWLDATGAVVETSAPSPGRVDSPRVSPDGRFIALMVNTESTHVYTYDVRRQVFSPLRTPEENFGIAPRWAPDGQWVYYSAWIGGEYDIHRGPLDRSAAVARVLERPGDQFLNDISPDGRYALFQERPDPSNQNSFDLYYFELEGGEPQPLLTSVYDERLAAFSPDGRWVAFQSDESGASQVYVTPFPGPGPTTQVSNDGGGAAVWARDGSAIAYTVSPGALMNAAIVPGTDLEFETPVRLIQRGFDRSTATVTYDSSLEGGWIASESVLRGNASSARPSMQLVFNWFSVLEERAPDR